MPEYDKIETLGRSTVQHGPCNQRVYLMKLHPDDAAGIPHQLDVLSREQGYGKIFVKIPKSLHPAFESAGYRQEACIPGFFRGQEDALFLARYLDPERRRDSKLDEVRRTLLLARSKCRPAPEALPDTPYRIGTAGVEHLAQIAELYREVFASYPFPIHDIDYLRSTMDSHVLYFCARTDDGLAALSSAEQDVAGKNVEMTDFATRPAHLGKGLALQLLWRMEQAMRERGFVTAYTMARALSAGMNITFAKLGYQYAGTLLNNTNISGHIESMNVWYKTLI